MRITYNIPTYKTTAILKEANFSVFDWHVAFPPTRSSFNTHRTDNMIETIPPTVYTNASAAATHLTDSPCGQLLDCKSDSDSALRFKIGYKVVLFVRPTTARLWSRFAHFQSTGFYQTHVGVFNDRECGTINNNYCGLIVYSAHHHRVHKYPWITRVACPAKTTNWQMPTTWTLSF